ncbi:aminopeptidase [Desulfovulcanus sp.]
MFTDTQFNKYAEVLIWGMKKARPKEFCKGDIVLVRTDKSALPLADRVFQKLLELGLNPVIRINLPEPLEKTFFTYASDEQITFKVPGDEELYNHLSGLISLLGPESLTHLKDIDPSRIGKLAVAKKYLRDILEKRENQGHFGWTLCLYPTQTLADAAGLTLEEYAGQVVKAIYLDNDDPCQEWERVYNLAQRVKNWLNSLEVEYFHVLSENTDLKVYPGEMRQWLGVSGHNIPSFEIFLSPDYRYTEGVYFADQPSYRSGNVVRGVRLEFRDGQVIDVKAEEGEEFVRKQLEMDAGAGRLGEFSLTDKRFSRISKFMAHTLYDENYGGEFGNCHIAVGASYGDTYAGDPGELTSEKKKELGFNDSALHWDLVNTETKVVYAYLKNKEKVTIYESGKFLLDGVER